MGRPASAWSTAAGGWASAGVNLQLMLYLDLGDRRVLQYDATGAPSYTAHALLYDLDEHVRMSRLECPDVVENALRHTRSRRPRETSIRPPHFAAVASGNGKRQLRDRKSVV